MPNSIAAIVVTYGATPHEVDSLINAVQKQVTHIILVDNGSPLLKQIKRVSHLHIIKLNNNYGLAYAQNIGIERAIKLKVDHVLFLDQDSVPHPGMVDKLYQAVIIAQGQGFDIAAAGPVTIDRRLGTQNILVLNGLLPRRYAPNQLKKNTFIEVAFLISSGSLVSIGALKKIGGQRSDYFIDHLDTEWCLRAKNLSYTLICVVDAKMQHTLGDTAKRVWFFGMRTVFSHQPLRDYYMFRNTLLMLRDVKLNFIWRLHFLWRLQQFMVYFCVFNPDRLKRLSLMILGLRDGLLNRRGLLDPKTFKLHRIPQTSLDLK